MTPFPYSVEVTASVETARKMMRVHEVRHLPVTEGDAVVGILSARELAVAIALGATEANVAKVCTREPYIVEHDARASDVAATLAERQIGSAVVLHHGKLAGIVTTTDICREYAAQHAPAEPAPDECA